jgi:isocitrate dehydrogenase kinase/phosphatase
MEVVHQARLHRAPHDPAQHLPAGSLRHAGHPESPAHAKRAKDQLEHAVVEYGNAIKDMVAANIFPGDMLWKNFGVTRGGKVVFYDYDEIEYITDCKFRKVPAAAQRGRRDERRGLVLGRPEGRVPRNLRALPARQRRVREAFMAHHADLLDAAFWQHHKERIQAGQMLDVFPYEESQRFQHEGHATHF